MFLETQSAAADNATATVTLAAPTDGSRRYVCAIDADFSAAVNAIKTVTLKYDGVAQFAWRWDFSLGPFQRNVPFAGPKDAEVSVELQASGTGGVTGRVGVWSWAGL